MSNAFHYTNFLIKKEKNKCASAEFFRPKRLAHIFIHIKLTHKVKEVLCTTLKLGCF